MNSGTRSLVLALVAVGATCGGLGCEEPATGAPAASPSAAAAPAAPEGAPTSDGPVVAAPAKPVVAAVSTASALDSAAHVELVGKAAALPGATGNAFLDGIAYERGARRVWVPVASTGSVDVFDIASGKFTRIDGFKTAEREEKGAKLTAGPSAAAMAPGVAYIGNRATGEVCAVDTKALKAGACVAVPGGLDGITYVASAKELWVSSVRGRSLTVLDASSPAMTVKATVKLAAEPRGSAVDDTNGLFYTNLGDKGDTAVIDVKTHAAKGSFNAGCNAEGPRGIAVDSARAFVLVACTDHVQVLDGGHNGAKLGVVDTGVGVDAITLLAEKKLVYTASGKDERLTVARLDDKGKLTIIATALTSTGARNAVADESGKAYVADSLASRVLVFEPAPAK